MTMTATDPETDLVPLPEEPQKRLSLRQRVRRHPQWGVAYRVGVGVVGSLLMIAALLSGPLPGPGGIPLFFLGIAVLASEFFWARRLHQRLTNFYHRYLSWPKNKRVTFWVGFLVTIWLFWYVSLIIVGIPDWMPSGVESVLMILPGVKN